jgi:spore maturation protein CgeB
MKILFISNRYKKGESRRGPNYGYHNFYDALLKMNNSGHQIVFFPVDEALISLGESQRLVRERLFQQIRREKPNLIFFLEGELGKETLKEMKGLADQIGAKTLWWASDDHWMFNRISKKLAPYFHWVVTTDSRAPNKYLKLGYKNVIHSQWAYNQYYFQPQSLPKIYDVSFVGQPHGKRRKMIEKIRKAGINVNCWGYGWPSGVLSQEEMVKVFCQSKINLHFSMSSGKLWKNFAQIFLKKEGERKRRKLMIDSPLNWLDNFKSFLGTFRTQIKGKNFEVPAVGGFLLTEDADNLKDYYEIGKEIACFKGIDDCLEKIKYYLNHDEEREKIARAGFQRAAREHTYEKRFNDIFKTMGLVKS